MTVASIFFVWHYPLRGTILRVLARRAVALPRAALLWVGGALGSPTPRTFRMRSSIASCSGVGRSFHTRGSVARRSRRVNSPRGRPDGEEPGQRLHGPKRLERDDDLLLAADAAAFLLRQLG